jgi:hypothetical protein
VTDKARRAHDEMAQRIFAVKHGQAVRQARAGPGNLVDDLG